MAVWRPPTAAADHLAAVTAVLGHWTDAGMILSVVLINAIIGAAQGPYARGRDASAIRNQSWRKSVAVRAARRRWETSIAVDSVAAVRPIRRASPGAAADLRISA